MTVPVSAHAQPQVLETEIELRNRLIDFIQASDPIRDLQTHEERRRLLCEPGSISAQPALELAPQYAAGPELNAIGLPSEMASMLTELASIPELGVFNPPYAHQAEAYRALLAEQSDILVASGTGSGKTETFLHPILARLGVEAKNTPDRFEKPGMRALILYPMNALVSDQIARLRRLFGADEVKDFFQATAPIPARFGMYTGRTPFPGPFTPIRNRDELQSIINYFLDLQVNDPKLFNELRQRGRIPSKDLQAIATAIECGIRPQTNIDDVELLTRDEMQTWCPHILVTNYSMLEYMLMRPIERSIFEQTRSLYRNDPEPMLFVVLDEAHLYRGVAGGEVSFLLRRLLSRLDLDRDRVQFILTSASMGEGDKAVQAAKQFAFDLAGRPSNNRSSIRFISGEVSRPLVLSNDQFSCAETLANLPATTFMEFDSHQTLTGEFIAKCADLGIHIDTTKQLGKSEQLGHALNAWPPLVRLRSLLGKSPKNLEEIETALFLELSRESAHKALGNLVELGGRAELEGHSVLPLRLHLFFRGIPPIYACINPSCTALDIDIEERTRSGLGKLFVSPRLHCDCGARTYELLIHRDCGARFLKAYEAREGGNFLWHEGGRIIEHAGTLVPVHLLLEEPHRQAGGKYEQIFLNIWTGQTQEHIPEERASDWISVCRPARKPGTRSPRPSSSMRFAPSRMEYRAEQTFNDCPACNKRNGGRALRSLGTIGDRPFATLVREQLLMQPGIEEINDTHPNAGRKSLIFSDGRQRAARLARDLPREIERDGFRQALMLGARRLELLGEEPTLDRRLYGSFISVCSDFHLTFFDQEGNAQQQLADGIRRYRKLAYGLEEFLEDDDEHVIDRFRLALLRQVSDFNYSLHQINVGFLAPSSKQMRKLKRDGRFDALSSALGEDPSAVVIRWIQYLLDQGAFDNIGAFQRESVRAFPSLEATYPLTKVLPANVVALLGPTHVLDDATDAMQELLTIPDSGEKRVLAPSKLVLRIAIDDEWWRCDACHQFFVSPILGLCSQCGSSEIRACEPNDPLLHARSNYFRASIRRVLAGERPVNLVVEEHTAQLSHRDRNRVWATTEEHELRFQDLRVTPQSPPIDVLSCTTTMEVGIDIGSLNAVGLGNVPPQRENYQQRAGRAGRRNARATTVLTYARNDAHDAYYFSNTMAMVAGPPRKPRIDADNPRIASRHINALLIQSFFHRNPESAGGVSPPRGSSDLFSSLGSLSDFFAPSGDYTFGRFRQWLTDKPLPNRIPASILDGVARLRNEFERQDYLTSTVQELVDRLETLAQQLQSELLDPNAKLLDALFDDGLLPSYAFPTDLCSFVIPKKGSSYRGEVEQRPQQDMLRALSEYAPGRKLIVNKKTYTVGGVFIEGLGRPDDRFQRYFEDARSQIIYCPKCTYIAIHPGTTEPGACPICHTSLQRRTVIDPPAFSPRAGTDDADSDSGQSFTTASQAQFPLPLEQESFEFEPAGVHLSRAFRRNQRLVISNTGQDDRGFLVCKKCGAVKPRSVDTEDIGDHQVPFLGSNGRAFRCTGTTFEDPIALSHQFSTDLLLIRGKLQSPMVSSPTETRLQDALRSLAEALVLSASLAIDIDPGELAAGYRFLPANHGSQPFEIFLYDAASGGAGYALEVGENCDWILDRTEELLTSCPEDCDRSCTHCLRHYGNRVWHQHLDRHLARSLLRFLRFGDIPEICTDDTVMLFLPLRRFLELEGRTCSTKRTSSGKLSLVVQSQTGETSVELRPSLLAGEPVDRSGQHTEICEYALTRNLPGVAACF